jgi:cyclic beta-1,2-glucan synthetase
VEPEIWVAHHAVLEGVTGLTPEFETDRARFLGRGRDLRTPADALDGRKLSNTVGTVLDPIFALRYRIRVAAGATVRLSFWTSVAPTREGLLNLVDKHRDANAFVRATTLAWTQAQVQLLHLGITAAEATLFQRLAGHLLYADGSLRSSSEAIRRGAASPEALWPQGISGDLPIVLLRIDGIDDLAIARQLLQAHEYWRMKHLAVDLVILNERASSYVQDLQVALEALVRMSQRPAVADGARGAVFILRTDLISPPLRAALGSIARVVLASRLGSLEDQLDRARAPLSGAPRHLHSPPPAEYRSSGPAPGELEFFNGYGGFAAGGSEYVTLLGPGRRTPMPWINVIANPLFGFQVATEGSGYTWSENSRENLLTPRSNDPVTDRTGEAWYVRDEDTRELWCPTASPMHDPRASYAARHGQGYSRFEHRSRGIELDLVVYVPPADPIKICRLVLRNTSNRTRRLSVTAYIEWVLGSSQTASAPFVITEIDAATGALFARCPWRLGTHSRVAFADLGARQTGWTADRREFLGRHGSVARPAALLAEGALSKRVGAGLDPCAALQTGFSLEPGGRTEVVFFLGEEADATRARALVAQYRAADLDAVLLAVVGRWDAYLGTVQVKTPDRALDLMLNGWLLYQTLVCRVWARSAFYQASGAYGFRDQLQDSMALVVAQPGLAREHLLRAAARQFIEGDVQHWWLPGTGQGVRTRITDDRAWLAYVCAHYVATSGDRTVLEEAVPFLEGPLLAANEVDSFFHPTVSEKTASLYEHCALALDASLSLGVHGLPLFGSGDWNDGMNRVGAGGRGESVWLGWMLYSTLTTFASLARGRGDEARATHWLTAAAGLQTALEATAWDGEWYRRGYYDDGTPLGSSNDAECRIDSIAQSWSVISGAAEPGRASQAMTEVVTQLVRPESDLALLFTPPFDHCAQDPGYIKGYPPGIRENGGQYTHAAAWSVVALATLGRAEEAVSLLSMLNPVRHTASEAHVERYKVEPYVVAADVYSVAPHVGRGGWTWYTGSAGWLYRAGLESVLGLRQSGTELRIEPCVPAHWPGFEIQFRHRSARYDIRLENPEAARARPGVQAKVAFTELDGTRLLLPSTPIVLADDGATHHVRVVLTLAAIPAATPAAPTAPPDGSRGAEWRRAD